jgi:tRNA dimethylallyltransferase
MATTVDGTPLVVIVGPTASGKSALAMRAAEKVGGEIIAADSRTIYKGMDIGTAKPTVDDQQAVHHHLLDVVEPGERFTAADFQAGARVAMEDIWRRSHIPVIVGGTGLYVDSVLYDYQFGADADAQLRQELSQKSAGELYEYCVSHNIELPSDVKNKRRLIRVIELQGVNRKRNATLRPNTLVVGIATNRSILQKRITARAHEMFDSGVVEEASSLASKYGWESEAMTGNIYRIIRRMLAGELTRSEAIERFVTSDMQLAKRQITWFKRNPYVIWSDDSGELLGRIIDFTKQYSIQ